eukprot:TRINITY_DN12220_c0_g1_i2.p1 TRINITY_DN12220_c0_g1~~TRINITY_DN12220_c0_g1_i2.p1  ORF type:complete len:109 (-),score=11.70 TRINITY_DN12220_c0_g1_i2:220-546(-)
MPKSASSCYLAAMPLPLRTSTGRRGAQTLRLPLDIVRLAVEEISDRRSVEGPFCTEDLQVLKELTVTFQDLASDDNSFKYIGTAGGHVYHRFGSGATRKRRLWANASP